jgi:hypothetical protein
MSLGATHGNPAAAVTCPIDPAAAAVTCPIDPAAAAVTCPIDPAAAARPQLCNAEGCLRTPLPSALSVDTHSINIILIASESELMARELSVRVWDAAVESVSDRGRTTLEELLVVDADSARVRSTLAVMVAGEWLEPAGEDAWVAGPDFAALATGPPASSGVER